MPLDFAQIPAPLPPVRESLTGINFEKLLEQAAAWIKRLARDEPKV